VSPTPVTPLFPPRGRSQDDGEPWIPVTVRCAVCHVTYRALYPAATPIATMVGDAHAFHTHTSPFCPPTRLTFTAGNSPHPED
jgi:hypothetical protein